MLIGTILSFVYANNQYQLTSALAEELTAEYPNSEQMIVEIIKSNHLGNIENNTLTSYGFGVADFLKPYAVTSSITVVACVIFSYHYLQESFILSIKEIKTEFRN